MSSKVVPMKNIPIANSCANDDTVSSVRNINYCIDKTIQMFCPNNETINDQRSMAIDSGQIKLIEIIRNKFGYGFTLSGERPCRLTMVKGHARSSGLFSGDRLHSVNGRSVDLMDHEEVVELITSAPNGRLVLGVSSNPQKDYCSQSDENEVGPKSNHYCDERFERSTLSSSTDDDYSIDDDHSSSYGAIQYQCYQTIHHHHHPSSSHHHHHRTNRLKCQQRSPRNKCTLSIQNRNRNHRNNNGRNRQIGKFTRSQQILTPSKTYENLSSTDLINHQCNSDSEINNLIEHFDGLWRRAGTTRSLQQSLHSSQQISNQQNSKSQLFTQSINDLSQSYQNNPNEDDDLMLHQHYRNRLRYQQRKLSKNLQQNQLLNQTKPQQAQQTQQQQKDGTKKSIRHNSSANKISDQIDPFRDDSNYGLSNDYDSIVANKSKKLLLKNKKTNSTTSGISSISPSSFNSSSSSSTSPTSSSSSPTSTSCSPINIMKQCVETKTDQQKESDQTIRSIALSHQSKPNSIVESCDRDHHSQAIYRSVVNCIQIARYRIDDRSDNLSNQIQRYLDQMITLTKPSRKSSSVLSHPEASSSSSSSSSSSLLIAIYPCELFITGQQVNYRVLAEQILQCQLFTNSAIERIQSIRKNFILVIRENQNNSICNDQNDRNNFDRSLSNIDRQESTLQQTGSENDSFWIRCFLFEIDQKLSQSHRIHSKIANLLDIHCTPDPIQIDHCLEFPETCEPILRIIYTLYRRHLKETRKFSHDSRSESFDQPRTNDSMRIDSSSSTQRLMPNFNVVLGDDINNHHQRHHHHHHHHHNDSYRSKESSNYNNGTNSLRIATSCDLLFSEDLDSVRQHSKNREENSMRQINHLQQKESQSQSHRIDRYDPFHQHHHNDQVRFQDYRNGQQIRTERDESSSDLTSISKQQQEKEQLSFEKLSQTKSITNVKQNCPLDLKVDDDRIEENHHLKFDHHQPHQHQQHRDLCQCIYENCIAKETIEIDGGGREEVIKNSNTTTTPSFLNQESNRNETDRLNDLKISKLLNDYKISFGIDSNETDRSLSLRTKCEMLSIVEHNSSINNKCDDHNHLFNDCSYFKTIHLNDCIQFEQQQSSSSSSFSSSKRSQQLQSKSLQLNSETNHLVDSVANDDDNGSGGGNCLDKKVSRSSQQQSLSSSSSGSISLSKPKLSDEFVSCFDNQHQQLSPKPAPRISRISKSATVSSSSSSQSQPSIVDPSFVQQQQQQQNRQFDHFYSNVDNVRRAAKRYFNSQHRINSNQFHSNHSNHQLQRQFQNCIDQNQQSKSILNDQILSSIVKNSTMLMMNNENKMDNEKCLNENDFEKKMSILSLNQNDSSMRKISPKCSGEESRIENETVRFTGQSNLQKTIVSDDPLKRSLDHDPETAIDSISKSESNASKSSTKPNYLFDSVFVGDSIEKNQTQSQSQSVSVDKSNTIVERNESMVLQFDPREYDWMDSPPTLYQTSGTRSYDERQSNDSNERQSSLSDYNQMHSSNEDQELEKHTERPIDVGWVGNWASDFDILLKDPIGIKAFADFLRKEFSHENLRFFLAVQEFKKLTDTDQIRIQSQEIYNKFISASAPDPVNVDSKGKKSVEHSLLNPDCRTFALAEKQIYNLMKFDSYVRFLKSEIYEKCLLLDLKGKTLPYEKDYVEDQDQDVLKQQKIIASKMSNAAAVKKRKSFIPWARIKSSINNKAASLSSMPASKELIGSRKQFMMRKLTNSITKIRSKSLDEHLTNHVCSKQLGSEPSSHSSSIDKNVLAQKSYHFCSSRSSLIPNSSDSIDSSDHTNVFQSSSDINRSVPDVGYIMTATSPPPYKTLIANSDPSSPLATSSLSTSSTSNQNRMKASSSSSFNHNCNRDNCHLLRIVFPDRSQTVIPPSPNETIDGLLTRLIEKRSLKYLAWDVFVTGSDKPLDPNTNANQLGCSELRVEQRVLFQIEFPSQDIIGVKARPNKLCCDVFKPLLLRYGYRPEHIVITVAETQQTVPSMSPVSLIDGQHILVSYRSDLEEWGWNVTRNNIPVALALSGKSFSEDNGKAQDVSKRNVLNSVNSLSISSIVSEKKLSKNCDNSVSIVEQRTSSLQSLPPNQSSSAPTVATYHNIDSSRDRIIIDDEIEKLNSSASTPGDDTQSDLFFQELIKTAHTVPSPAGDALTRTSYGVNIESQQFQEVAGQTQTYLTKPNRNSQPISASHSPTHRTLRDLQNHRHFKSYQPSPLSFEPVLIKKTEPSDPLLNAMKSSIANSSPSINIMEEQILSRPIVHRENLTIPSPQKPPLRRMKSDPPPPLPPKSGCIVSNPSQQRPMESKPLNENEDRRKD